MTLSVLTTAGIVPWLLKLCKRSTSKYTHQCTWCWERFIRLLLFIGSVVAVAIWVCHLRLSWNMVPSGTPKVNQLLISISIKMPFGGPHFQTNPIRWWDYLWGWIPMFFSIQVAFNSIVNRYHGRKGARLAWGRKLQPSENLHMCIQ